jgi:hypothetical protein
MLKHKAVIVGKGEKSIIVLNESRAAVKTCRDYQDRKYLSSIEAAQGARGIS